MPINESKKRYSLNLRAGEIVEVRSPEEILRTLDEKGRLEALPFMPEMLKYCGKRFKVYKRADKTCDTIEKTGCRRMVNTVHLEGLRCDGEAHGGCEAGCLLFWKEAWLKRVEPESIESTLQNTPPLQPDEEPLCTLETLFKATRSSVDPHTPDSESEVFSCQATELQRATSYLSRWDFRHYLRDLRSGNRSILEVLHTLFFEIFNEILHVGIGYRALLWLFNTFQKIRGKDPYPYQQGKLRKTPSAVLNLKPGELVRVKSHKEILETLDVNNKNRGLSFDVEMTLYCGGIYRVARRVRKIIHEKTRKMIKLPNDCIILEDVICKGVYHQLCPRSIFPYWREIWLEKVEEPSQKETKNA